MAYVPFHFAVSSSCSTYLRATSAFVGAYPQSTPFNRANRALWHTFGEARGVPCR